MIWALVAAAVAVWFWPQSKPAGNLFDLPAAPVPSAPPAEMLQRLIDVRGYLAAAGRITEAERKAIDTLALAIMAGGEE